MNLAFLKPIVAYLGARLTEPSTWAGIGMLVSSVQARNWQQAGMAIGGLLAIFVPEKSKVAPVSAK